MLEVNLYSMATTFWSSLEICRQLGRNSSLLTLFSGIRHGRRRNKHTTKQEAACSSYLPSGKLTWSGYLQEDRLIRSPKYERERLEKNRDWKVSMFRQNAGIFPNENCKLRIRIQEMDTVAITRHFRDCSKSDELSDWRVRRVENICRHQVRTG